MELTERTAPSITEVVQPPGSSHANGDALLALYTEVWGEIHHLRDYQWKITYYFVSLGAGLIVLLLSQSAKPLLSFGVRVVLSIVQVAAAILGVFYLEMTHRYLTVQRNIRGHIEDILGFRDRDLYAHDSVLPHEWKGKRMSHSFQRMGLLVPLMAMLLVVQGFSVYLIWKVPWAKTSVRQTPGRSAVVPKGELLMDGNSVSFRYAGIVIGDEEIPGICLCYATEHQAREVYAVLHEYITASGNKSMRVSFSGEAAGTYSMKIDVLAPRASYNAEISGIESCHVQRIRELLGQVTYYVVLAGYEEGGEYHLLPCDEFHLFKRDVVIDGEVTMGKPGTGIDWMSIFGT